MSQLTGSCSCACKLCNGARTRTALLPARRGLIVQYCTSAVHLSRKAETKTTTQLILYTAINSERKDVRCVPGALIYRSFCRTDGRAWEFSRSLRFSRIAVVPSNGQFWQLTVVTWIGFKDEGRPHSWARYERSKAGRHRISGKVRVLAYLAES